MFLSVTLKRNRVLCVHCVNENRKKRKRLRLNGNRALFACSTRLRFTRLSGRITRVRATSRPLFIATASDPD